MTDLNCFSDQLRNVVDRQDAEKSTVNGFQYLLQLDHTTTMLHLKTPIQAFNKLTPLHLAVKTGKVE